MALGIVQAGYKSSLYVYTAGKTPDLECSYAELLAELTTELELALEGSMEDAVADSKEGEESNTSEDGQSEVYSDRKKDWEEQLEQATVVEAMLRQALENGLGQKNEEENTPQKKEEETDNDFSLEGIPMPLEGRSRSSAETERTAGTAQFLQTNSGYGAEHFSQTNGGRATWKQQMRILCLTCETECEQKKRWKITE